MFNYLAGIFFFLICSFLLTYVGENNSVLRAKEGMEDNIYQFSIINLFLGILLWFGFYKNLEFQFLVDYSIFVDSSFLSFGVDGLSLLFLLLTLFIFPLCFLAVQQKLDFVLLRRLLIIEFLLVLSFTTLDLLYFYIFFETLLIPMVLYIGIKGSRARKIKAAYYFFLYTVFGSLFMLIGIFYVYYLLGSTHFFILLNSNLTMAQQLVIWLLFFMAFAVKMPLFPFHLWLLEAHVEAPTIGSVILASLLLKLGGYGFLRFSLTFLSDASFYFAPAVICLSMAGVIYGSLATIRQVDLKRIIAYSSVAHMNLVVLGLFSFNFQAIEGAIYLMLAHGFVSGALFFCIGVFYDRYHTRLIRYYGGRALLMPIFATFFLLFTLANMSLPGTANFIGEFLIFTGLFSSNFVALCGALSGVVLSAVYSLWLYNRVMFGTIKLLEYDQFIKQLFTFFEQGFGPFEWTVLYDWWEVRDLFILETMLEKLEMYTNQFYHLALADIAENEFFIFVYLLIPTLWFGLSTNTICHVSSLPVSLLFV